MNRQAMGVQVVTSNMITPPDGHRKLEPLERVGEGDLFFGKASQRWLPVTQCLDMTAEEAMQVNKCFVAFARKVYVPSVRTTARGWMNA